VREYPRADSIQLIKKARRLMPWPLGRKKIMNRNKSKLAAVALVAAIGLGIPALAKSTHSGKARQVASQIVHSTNAQRARALDAYGSVRRAPTFGAPNPNSPALTGGGSSGYNAYLYVY
jgi:hypothetical protein